MDLFEVNQQTCNKDGICAAVCPAKIIDFQKGQCPTPSAEAEEICTRCGHCVAVCPTASLSHSEMPVSKCPPIQKDLHLNAEHCEHFLRSRRSIRVYKDKPASKDDLTKLIEVARYAPSGHNVQKTEWLVFGNRAELHNLAGIIIDWMRWVMENMKELAMFLHMDRSIEGWENGSYNPLRNAPVVIVTHTDKEDIMAPINSSIALTYLELFAPSMGLGTCWAGLFMVAAATFPPMIEALSLPDGHQCYGSMMVGYPKFAYRRLHLRKPPEITFHL